MRDHLFQRLAAIVLTWAFLGADAICEAASKPPQVPDLIQGGVKDDKHDWNLGPIGARGWIWGWKLETINSRQILITEMDKGSPADGVLEVGDVRRSGVTVPVRPNPSCPNSELWRKIFLITGRRKVFWLSQSNYCQK